MNPQIASEELYFKITNEYEIHNGFVYKDGLNILTEEFNDDPQASCVAGGFYFTTKEFIHDFYHYGCYLRVIELPIGDLVAESQVDRMERSNPDFKMIKDPQGNKYRANKIILKERYSLDDIETYNKFGIKCPTLQQSAYHGHLQMVKYLIGKQSDIHTDNEYEYALIWSARNGHLEVVKYLIEKGADIHANNDETLVYSAANGHLEVVKYLVEKGADIYANNDETLVYSAANGHLEVVKYLVEKEADIYANNGQALRWSARNGHLEVVKYLIEKGADIHANNDEALGCSAANSHLEVVKYLVEKGADIHANDGQALRWSFLNSHPEVTKYLKQLASQKQR